MLRGDHRGNIQNDVLLEEHDGLQNAKRVSLVSSATIYAVTSSTVAGLTTLGASPNYIGLVTNTPAQAWPDPKGFIGLVTVVGATGNTGNVTLNPGPNYIGLVTAVIGNTPTTTLSGNVTLDAGSRTGIVGNVTLSDSKGFIGLVTATGNIGITGNVTLSDSKGYIGLVTVTQASTARSITGNITLTDSKGYIGLVTATLDNARGVSVVGNMTLSDSKGFIGLTTTTLGASPAYVGLVSATITNAVGNATLNPSPNFIGLVTAYIPGYTYTNFTSDGTILIKSGAGTIHTISINTKSTGGTAILYDSLTPGGTKIATIDTTLSQETLTYDANFSTGLSLDTTAVTAAGDLTISWR